MDETTLSLCPASPILLPCGEEIGTRDLRSGDARLYPRFHANVTAEDRRTRFFSSSPLSESQIARLTRTDAANAIIRAAIGQRSGDLYGVSRLHRIEGRTGEFAVMVRSDVKGRGLGQRLLAEVIAAAPGIGIDRIVGLILPENACMRGLVEHLGFAVTCDPAEPGLLRASLAVMPQPLAA
jgi:RimJ/RimL family protein N-acetyltransferase